ncbi:hypothetical protein OB919_15855 [Halobacteria archaeon AArc-curdl1]|uniref:Uncharacterized protein n=1 Tax=Natronosalvus hydrolyticus TaxID=2979988 RepID=A0AAP2ZCR2_9EURY|nr:hypothetical protein [Halobacteria archaeon AArc-curdl1]
MLKKRCTRTAVLLVAGFLLLMLVAGAAAAQTQGNETSEDNDEEEGILSSIQDLVSELSEFNSNYEERMGETLTDGISDVLFGPFEYMVIHLIPELILLLSQAPGIEGNGAVETLHQQTLLIAYLMSGTAFVAAGLLYMTGPLFGVSFREARMIVPRLIVALLFGTFAIPLLQLTIDFSNAMTWAFRTEGLGLDMEQLVGLSAGLVLVSVLKAILLLILVIMYALRDVFILFLPAIAPLIAFFWAFPRSKKYADRFIGLFWALLAMGPLNMMALSFILEMMRFSVDSPLQSVSNWIYGVTALALLIILPYQLYGVSQAVAGPATAFAGAAVQTASKRVQRRGESGEIRRGRGVRGGYTREDMLKMRDVAHREERRRVKEDYEQRTRKPEVKPYEWARLDPDQTDLNEFDEKGRRILWDGGR